MLQVVAVPVVTFSADTLGFCKPVVLPELLLTLIYCSFSVLIAIVGAATLDVTDFFGFYKVRFRQSLFGGTEDTYSCSARSPEMMCLCLSLASWLRHALPFRGGVHACM